MAIIYPKVLFVSAAFMIVNYLSQGLAANVDILKVENEQAVDKIWNVANLRALRVRPGKYGVNGTVELLQTLDDTSKFEVKGYYSSNGVERYQLIPHHLGPKQACVTLNTDYKKYFPNAGTRSTFPKIKNGEYYCPLKKDIYKFNNYEFVPVSIPHIFKQGFYKVQLCTFTESGDQSLVAIYLKVTH